MKCTPCCRLPVRAYELLICFATPLQSLVLLIFRLYWGWRLFLTGKGKLMNHEGVTGFFTSLGIPFPGLNAWFVGCVECFGGILLLIGLCSRPTAFFVACTMVVAYLSVDADREKVANIFSDPAPFLAAAPFFFLLMSVLVLAFGPGWVSVDGALKYWCKVKGRCGLGASKGASCDAGNRDVK